MLRLIKQVLLLTLFFSSSSYAARINGGGGGGSGSGVGSSVYPATSTILAAGGISASTMTVDSTVYLSSNVYVGNIQYTDPTHRFIFMVNDFLTVMSGQFPWLGGTVNGGALSNANAERNHIGVIGMRSGALVNSGYQDKIDPTAFLLGGGESTDMIFQVGLSSNNLSYLGFHDTANQVAPVDAVMLKISSTPSTGLIIVGQTYNNSTWSQTNTSFTITGAATTWYHAKIVLNANATLATFSLLNENGGTLWTDTINSNIPTGTARCVGHGVVALSVGTEIFYPLTMDYMDVKIDRRLER